jgi:thiamine pyrophosphokinase
MASCVKLLGELLKCSPLVIVLDSAMERVMKLKVDVGDFDRDFDANYYKEHQHQLKYTQDQSKTDLEKAFDYLYERKIAAVNVVWATGKRTDHTITNLTNIVRYREN